MVIKIEQRTHYSGHISGPRSQNTYHSHVITQLMHTT